MWYGQYNHTLDNKDRFILPSKLREKLKSIKNKIFYITRGLDGCLFVFHQDTWNQLEEKLRSLSFTKQQARSFNRLYFSGACEVEIDGQGRITLPSYLKDFAKIAKEIVIIGVGDRMEIWDKNVWAQFYEKNKEKFEDVAEDLF